MTDRCWPAKKCEGDFKCRVHDGKHAVAVFVNPDPNLVVEFVRAQCEPGDPYGNEWGARVLPHAEAIAEMWGSKQRALDLACKALGNLRAHADRYCDCVMKNDTHAWGPNIEPDPAVQELIAAAIEYDNAFGLHTAFPEIKLRLRAALKNLEEA